MGRHDPVECWLKIGDRYEANPNMEVLKWVTGAVSKHRNRFEMVCHKCTRELGVEMVYYVTEREIAQKFVPCRCRLKDPHKVKAKQHIGGFDSSRTGHLYVLKVKGDSHQFTGFGITGHLRRRMAEHTKNLTEAGYTVDEQVVFSAQGRIVEEAEKMLKDTVEIAPTRVDGFITEATHESLFDFVVSKIKLFLWGDAKYGATMSYA